MTERTALITGATGLLGRQVLKAFARRDWTAKGTGLSRADGATILKVDLASHEEVEKALDHSKYTIHQPPPGLLTIRHWLTMITTGLRLWCTAQQTASQTRWTRIPKEHASSMSRPLVTSPEFVQNVMFS